MRRAKIGVFVHLVWATWDRLPLLTPEAETQAYRAIGAKCQQLGVDILAIGGTSDHVHLLVRLPGTVCISDLVKHVKGSSGHLLAKQMQTDDTFFKWQGAYGAFSVSPSELRTVSQYIARQKEHHAAGTLVADWEASSDDTINQ